MAVSVRESKRINDIYLQSSLGVEAKVYFVNILRCGGFPKAKVKASKDKFDRIHLFAFVQYFSGVKFKDVQVLLTNSQAYGSWSNNYRKIKYQPASPAIISWFLSATAQVTETELSDLIRAIFDYCDGKGLSIEGLEEEINSASEEEPLSTSTDQEEAKLFDEEEPEQSSADSSASNGKSEHKNSFGGDFLRRSPERHSVNVHDNHRSVLVDGVLRRLSNNIVVAPPIPKEFGSWQGAEGLNWTFGRYTENYSLKGDFVEQSHRLWRHWSYPAKEIGSFYFGKSQFDAIVQTPSRGLYIHQPYPFALSDLFAFEKREPESFRAMGFIILLYEGDSLEWLDSNIYEHLINSVELHFDSFQRKKYFGQRNSRFKEALATLKQAKPWVGDVHDCPFTIDDDGLTYLVQESILKAHTNTMLNQNVDG